MPRKDMATRLIVYYALEYNINTETDFDLSYAGG